MIANDLKYKRFRFPIAVISHVIYLYNRFTLSYRDVSDLLLERGIVVSHQTIKKWNVRFGEMFAEEIKCRRRKPTRRWHIDEMHCKIAGKETLPLESSRLRWHRARYFSFRPKEQKSGRGILLEALWPV